MNLRHLTCFCCVARHLSFVDAANELYITQSTVTKYIHALEKELGFPLFQRTTRNVLLTKEGERFYPQVKKMLALYEQSVEDCRTQYQSRQETICVGYFSNMGEFLFPHLFVPFRQKYPNWNIKLVKVTTSDAMERLWHDEIDCFFAAEDFFELPKSVAYKHLCNAQSCLLMNAENPLSAQATLSPADLNDQKILIPPCRPAMPHTQKVIDAFTAQGKAYLLVETNWNLEEQLMMVMSGQYMQIVPSYNCQRRSELSSVPFPAEFDFSFGLVFSKNKEKSLDFYKHAAELIQV